MRLIVDTNIFVSAALKEKSLPGIAAHLVAESGVLLKSDGGGSCLATS